LLSNALNELTVLRRQQVPAMKALPDGGADVQPWTRLGLNGRGETFAELLAEPVDVATLSGKQAMRRGDRTVDFATLIREEGQPQKLGDLTSHLVVQELKVVCHSAPPPMEDA
jgi:hypothetical protein